MSLIIEKTYNLLDVLDNSELIKKLTNSKEKIEKDNEVLSLIKRINDEQNNKIKIGLRKQLYNNQNYKDYIDSYNELSYIVLKINKMIENINMISTFLDVLK